MTPEERKRLQAAETKISMLESVIASQQKSAEAQSKQIDNLTEIIKSLAVK